MPRPINLDSAPRHQQDNFAFVIGNCDEKATSFPTSFELHHEINKS